MQRKLSSSLTHLPRFSVAYYDGRSALIGFIWRTVEATKTVFMRIPFRDNRPLAASVSSTATRNPERDFFNVADIVLATRQDPQAFMLMVGCLVVISRHQCQKLICCRLDDENPSQQAMKNSRWTSISYRVHSVCCEYVSFHLRPIVVDSYLFALRFKVERRNLLHRRGKMIGKNQYLPGCCGLSSNRGPLTSNQSKTRWISRLFE